MCIRDRLCGGSLTAGKRRRAIVRPAASGGRPSPCFKASRNCLAGAASRSFAGLAVCVVLFGLELVVHVHACMRQTASGRMQVPRGRREITGPAAKAELGCVIMLRWPPSVTLSVRSRPPRLRRWGGWMRDNGGLIICGIPTVARRRAARECMSLTLRGRRHAHGWWRRRTDGPA